MNIAVLPGAESLSHVGGSSVGTLLIHGFTGSPSSMRGIAAAAIDAGFDVELPRLPGHGTDVDEMSATGWPDWLAEADHSYRVLADRVDRVVIAGQSMGATLALRLALDHADVAGVVCVNPATRGRAPEELEMIDEFIDDGIAVVPGEGSDIADPDAFDIAYDGTPLRPLRSFLIEGIAPITGRFGELSMPLRLFTSRQDHVVDPGDSEHLAATYGGPVEQTWLDRSFHVATRDFDREIVESGSVDFVRRVTGAEVGR